MLSDPREILQYLLTYVGEVFEKENEINKEEVIGWRGSVSSIIYYKPGYEIDELDKIRRLIFREDFMSYRTYIPDEIRGIISYIDGICQKLESLNGKYEKLCAEIRKFLISGDIRWLIKKSEEISNQVDLDTKSLEKLVGFLEGLIFLLKLFMKVNKYYQEFFTSEEDKIKLHDNVEAIYLKDEDGEILWLFKPKGNYVRGLEISVNFDTYDYVRLWEGVNEYAIVKASLTGKSEGIKELDKIEVPTLLLF